MTELRSRDELLDSLRGERDVVVVGGGITGAGVFELACRRGLDTLLVEQRDFGWGTSSRSGKLVHGGLRYITQGQIRTSIHAVRERERLLRRYAGLVTPLTFAFPTPRGGFAARLATGALLALYDRMSGRRSRRYHPEAAFLALAPGLATAGTGGFSYLDGTTDDARLVLRVLDEGQRRGGTALSYLEAVDLVRSPGGRVRGVALRDAVTGRSYEVGARVVISATGAWADELRGKLGRPPRMRRLRGSHLVLAGARLPLERAVGLRSPRDGRGMYVMPWEGATLLGTTDLDHDRPLADEPRIEPDEGAYLLETTRRWFPDAGISKADVVATFAGVRPVVGTGRKDPSKESRDEVVFSDDGLVTISGGKLTTFPMMARRALAAASVWLDGAPGGDEAEPQPDEPRPPGEATRIDGRYGDRAGAVLGLAPDGAPETVADTAFLWAELRHAARAEQVVHLEDLLLRRTRVGLLLPEGGAALLERVRAETQFELGWDDARWDEEEAAYRRLWREAYSPELLG